MVVVTDHASDLPGTVLVWPQVNELAFANPNGVLVARMVEAVNAYLERAVSFHVIDLHRPRNQFPGGLAADVVLYALGQCCSSQGDSALIMIKLHVIDKECSEFLQVATIVGIEQCGIEGRDRLIKLRLRFNVSQCFRGTPRGLWLLS